MADDLCTICLELISVDVDGRDVRITPCGHIFHHTCIRPWLIGRYGNNRDTRGPFCPNCKRRIQFRSTMPYNVPQPAQNENNVAMNDNGQASNEGIEVNSTAQEGNEVAAPAEEVDVQNGNNGQNDGEGEDRGNVGQGNGEEENHGDAEAGGRNDNMTGFPAWTLRRRGSIHRLIYKRCIICDQGFPTDDNNDCVCTWCLNKLP
ncbi:probable E3 ubiquitin-protein ligase RHC1A [Contarinia nasturtii]|uniref:probable E3 ubiquitin-protein ligase RHC1A n=1 Tax=Contarinia nasturtii TaxID=265458 RepID=UPI0012D3EAD5|nr:probable E3 ubiquitin-protein ligase RHC1A [Contarinia nasturtii]